MKNALFCFYRTLVWIGLSVICLSTVPGVDGLACGRVLNYNQTEYLCCGGYLEDLYKDGTEMACCKTSAGYSLYRKDTELCCGEQVGVPKFSFHRGKKYERKCCLDGQIAEDHKLERCCGGESGDLIKVTLTKATDQCCHIEVYDKNDQFCCEHVPTGQYELYKKGEIARPSCCGKTMYDYNKHWCTNKENGTLKAYKEGYVMCREDQINPDTSICCEDTDTVKPKPPVTGLPRFAVPPNYQCRENITFDANRYKFIPSSSSYRAHLIPLGYEQCANDSYNKFAESHQEFCCLDTVRNASKNMNVSCCGRELYDTDTEFCCGDHIRRKNGQEACCGVSSATLYNKSALTCCDGKLIGKTHVCCSVTSNKEQAILKEERNHTKCCILNNGSMKSYNEWDKRCNNMEIKPIREPRQHFTEPCPFCGNRKKKNISKACNLKRDYKVRNNNATMNELGTILSITILQPRQYRGTSLDILLPYHCHCFKLGKKYIISTNRKLETRDYVKIGHRRSFIMRSSRNNRRLKVATCSATKLFEKAARKMRMS